MSIRLWNRVWDSVPLKGTELLLLLAIADHANEQGICWPRQERLAERVRCSVRQTRRLMRDLETRGYVSLTEGRGRGKVPVIRMNLEVLANLHKVDTDDRYSDSLTVDTEVPIVAKGATKSGVNENRTFSATLHASEEAEKRTSRAQEVAKSSVSDNRTASAALQDGDAAQNRTFSITERVQYSPERVRLRIEAMQAEVKKRTASAQNRTSVTEKRTASAPKADIAPHAYVEPSKNHQWIRQENQKSVFSAAQTAPDARSESGSESISERATTHAEADFVDEVGEAVRAQPSTVAVALASMATEPGFNADNLPVAHDLFGAVVNVVAKVARGPEAEDTPQQRYFNVLAWIVGADYSTISKEVKGQIAQTVGILQKAGYTEEDLRTFWHSIWKKDWRWTRSHAHPTLTQVRAEIGKLRVDQQAEALAMHASTGRDSNGKPILTPEELEMQRLMREAKERGRLKREAAQNKGLRVPDLQGHEMGLSGSAGGGRGIRESFPLSVPTGD